MSINWQRLIRLFKKNAARYQVDNPSDKNFHDELRQFNQRIIQQQNFALVRFGDGEMIIINGKAIDLSQKFNGEHQYIPGDKQHEQQRELLRQSLIWQSPNYYVGIACPCCVGTPAFLALKDQSYQPEQQLTWANIFVNANFSSFMSDTTAALAKRKVNMICHTKADITGLPFTVNTSFRSGPNSWLNDHQRLLEETEHYIESNKITDEVFIFCAGVLSNILVYQLSERFPNNTYIDVGSVFDEVMGLGKTRKYLRNGRTLRQTCLWV